MRLWLDLTLPTDPFFLGEGGGLWGVFWSVSAPRLSVRHMQYVERIFLFICMIIIVFPFDGVYRDEKI